MKRKPNSFRERAGKILFSKRRIRSNNCWEWMGPRISKRKYHDYGLVCFGGKRYLAHRLSAQIFDNFNPRSVLQVNHKCDNPPCFNPKHFFYGTQADNIRDSMRKKRLPQGETNGFSRLKEWQVRFIRTNYRRGLGGLNQERLAEMFGVSPTTVGFVVRRQTWKNFS